MSADLYLTLVLLLGACVLFALIYISYWLRILAKKDWKFEIENNINNNFTTALTGQQIRELVGNNPLMLKDEMTGRQECAMRVFLEVKEENGDVRYINIDKIEDVLAQKDGTYLAWTDHNETEIILTEEEFLKWKKFVEVIR